jgi:hypothetical protein
MKNETLINPNTRTRNSVNVNWFSVCKSSVDNVIQITSKSSSLTLLVYKVTEDLIILEKLIRDNKRIVVPKKRPRF